LTLLDDLRQRLIISEASEASSTAILGGFFNTQLSRDVQIRETAAQNIVTQNIFQENLTSQIQEITPTTQNNTLRNALILVGILLLL